MKERSINTISRRDFVKTLATATTVGGASAFLLPGCSGNLASARSSKSIIKKDSLILFQGDSITDAGRDRRREGNTNDSSALGKGYVYPTMAGASLMAQTWLRIVA